MAVPMMTGDPSLDVERRSALRRMRSVAVGLLLVAAAVYLLTRDEQGFLGYVNAGAEASMVGAIADWFAVVALFKHPLGLPIPHTALIPERKDMLGRSLEEFVGENFLQEQIIRDRLAVADLGRKAGDWVVEPENAARVVREVSSVLRIGLLRLKDEDVASLVTEVLLPRFVEEPVSPIAGSLLKEVVRDKAHHGLVDLVFDEMLKWMRANEETFSDIIVERAPWWAPQSLNERVTHRLHIELVDWLEEISANPFHPARTALDRLLDKLADDLLEDPGVQARMEALKERVLEHPQVTVTFTSLWNALRRVLTSSLEDPDGLLQQRLNHELVNFGRRLQEDDTLRARVDKTAADLAVFVVDRYGSELTAVITHTIDRWDGREASRRIELFVGKDLQFIRINGTLVGGLVGLIIHAVSLNL
ncbi:MAG TPA: DUF445 domain-containing protein [Nocardioidaceae bacterium]|nr:DUF445 domain-containing protein [Nocardioidaceae bacterium]